MALPTRRRDKNRCSRPFSYAIALPSRERVSRRCGDRSIFICDCSGDEPATIVQHAARNSLFVLPVAEAAN
jgi:hypothetical protein